MAPWLSSTYIFVASMICLMLLRQAMDLAFSLAFDNAGSSIAARIAMMAMTTSSSIKVNARKFFIAGIKPLSLQERKGEMRGALNCELLHR